jgi:hypothetical protein
MGGTSNQSLHFHGSALRFALRLVSMHTANSAPQTLFRSCWHAVRSLRTLFESGRSAIRGLSRRLELRHQPTRPTSLTD